jgi:hypothetical protein
MIEFRKRKQIDDNAWNHLIDHSSNGLVYARTSFLDTFSPGWSALILGDYQAVMPLTNRRKYGISYLYQPSFCQQLGIFGKVDEQITGDFIKTAKRYFRFAEIHLNYSNQVFGTQPRQNFIISLNHSYDSIAAGFSPVHLKNLKRAANTGLRYTHSDAFEANINLNYQLYGSRIRAVRRSDFDALIELSRAEPGRVLVREVWRADDLQASAICFFDGSRIYFVISSVTEPGKKNQANHFLVDQLIREYAGRDLVLDFEGSDMEGIAAFYRGFGALDQPYFFLKWNELPWYYRLFKK